MEQTNRRCPTHGVPLARHIKVEITDDNKVRRVVEYYCRICAGKKALEKYKARALRIERMKRGLPQ